MWINKAEIIKDFIVKIWYEDQIMIIDFEKELQKDEWYYEAYRDVKKFQKELIVDCGTLAWGEGWDLHFDDYVLYRGKIGNIIEVEPIELKWSVAQYSKYFGLTKQAVFTKIWNNKLPKNVVATKKENGEYILNINSSLPLNQLS